MKLFCFWLFFEAFTSLHISCKASIYPARWWRKDDHRESNPVILCLLRSIGSPELPQKATNIRNLASSRKMRVLRSSETIQKKMWLQLIHWYKIAKYSNENRHFRKKKTWLQASGYLQITTGATSRIRVSCATKQLLRAHKTSSVSTEVLSHSLYPPVIWRVAMEIP